MPSSPSSTLSDAAIISKVWGYRCARCRRVMDDGEWLFYGENRDPVCWRCEQQLRSRIRRNIKQSVSHDYPGISVDGWLKIALHVQHSPPGS